MMLTPSSFSAVASLLKVIKRISLINRNRFKVFGVNDHIKKAISIQGQFVTHFIATTSSMNSTLFGIATSFVSGVKYPMMPIFLPSLASMIIEGLRFSFTSTGSLVRSKLDARTGKSTSSRNFPRFAEPSSNSWLPSDCGNKSV